MYKLKIYEVIEGTDDWPMIDILYAETAEDCIDKAETTYGSNNPYHFLRPVEVDEAEVRAEAAAALGRISTPRKAAAVRENGKLGGRPRIVYQQPPMSIDGPHSQITVSKTSKGIVVKGVSLFDNRDYKRWFTDGNYPAFPQSWSTEAANTWLHQLNGYTPDRKY